MPMTSVADLMNEVERLRKVVADQALTIGTLKDENARNRSDFPLANAAASLRAQLHLANDEVTKLREEAQTARLALDVAMREIAVLKTAGEIGGAENKRLHAKLKWFEDRRVGEDTTQETVKALRAYEQENPPPGAAT